MLKLIIFHSDIDEVYLFVKCPYQANDQSLINKREGVGLEEFDNTKAFVEYSKNMHDVYQNTEQ